jgi:hypothetical protein
MTVAQFITVEQTKRLMIELQGAVPEGVFQCAAVSHCVPDVDFRFTERRRLELAQR